MSTALSFFRPNEVGELLPLYKTVETKVDAEKSEFWNISGSYMPDKALCDRISDAAGISYTENCGVRTERVQEPYYGYNELIFIGWAQGEVTEPDGTKRISSVCEYEYNVRFRAEEDFLKDEEKVWEEQKYNTDHKKKLYILSLLRSARQRANTGARRRVINELTGMKTGFKKLFNERDIDTVIVTFKFKKVVANPENELVLKAGLNSMFSTKNALYGPGTALPEPITPVERKITGNTTPIVNNPPAPGKTLSNDFDDIPLDTICESPAGKLNNEITYLLEDKNLSDKTRQQIKSRLNPDASVEELTELKSKIEKMITASFLQNNSENSLLLPQTQKEIKKLLERMARREASYEEAVMLKGIVEKELNTGGLF